MAYTDLDWNYERKESEFTIIPVGAHRLRIESVEKAQSKSGRDMLVIKYAVSGFTNNLWDYIVFMKENPALTNEKLTKVFDSFGIVNEEIRNLNSWVGKVGACVTKHEEYNGETSVKVHYYLPKGSKQDSLPAWVNKTTTTTTNTTIQAPVNDITDDLPF